MHLSLISRLRLRVFTLNERQFTQIFTSVSPIISSLYLNVTTMYQFIKYVIHITKIIRLKLMFTWFRNINSGIFRDCKIIKSKLINQRHHRFKNSKNVIYSNCLNIMNVSHDYQILKKHYYNPGGIHR